MTENGFKSGGKLEKILPPASCRHRRSRAAEVAGPSVIAPRRPSSPTARTPVNNTDNRRRSCSSRRSSARTSPTRRLRGRHAAHCRRPQPARHAADILGRTLSASTTCSASRATQSSCNHRRPRASFDLDAINLSEGQRHARQQDLPSAATICGRPRSIGCAEKRLATPSSFRACA